MALVSYADHMRCCSHFMDGSTSLSALLDRLDDKIDKEGLDFLNPGRLFACCHFFSVAALPHARLLAAALAHKKVSQPTRATECRGKKANKMCSNGWGCYRSSAL